MPEDNDSDQDLAVCRLVSWARDHGASFPKLRFDHEGGRPRRLLLTAPALAGETLISVPRPLLLRGDLAYEDAQYGRAFRELERRCCAKGPAAAVGEEEGGDGAKDADDDAEDAREAAVAACGGGPLDARSALVLLVAVERCRGPRSRWAPYLAALPTSYDDPAWWSPRDRARLGGTRLGAAADRYDGGLACIAARLRLLEQLFSQEKEEEGRGENGGGGAAGNGKGGGGKRTGPLAAGASGPGGWGPVWEPQEALKAARWARSVVWSRAFGVARWFCRPGDGGNGSGGGGDGSDPSPPPPRPAVCLVPVLDMADHHPDARVAWHAGEDGRAGALEFSSRAPLPLPAAAAATKG
jgi:hypothetical protein